MASLPAHKARKRPPAFIPVKVRARRDGWTPQIQCAFLAELYITGSVAAAARAVGRSRKGAYALRSRTGAESFAAAWDHVLAGPRVRTRSPRRVDNWRKVTGEALDWRIEMGFWRPIVYRGAMRAIAREADNSGLLRQVYRQIGRPPRVGPTASFGVRVNFTKGRVHCHSSFQPDPPPPHDQERHKEGEITA